MLKLPTGTITARIMGGVTRIGGLLGLLLASTGAAIVRHDPLAVASTNSATASSNTAVVITLAAVPGARNVISGVTFSYSGAAATGNLKIEDVSGTTVFSVDYTAPSTAGAPVTINFPQPIMNAVANTALIVTLAAGGSGAVGRLNLHGVWTENAGS